MGIATHQAGERVSKFEVQSEELAALAAAYMSMAARIEAELQELTGRTAPLRAGWIGSSSAPFQTATQDIESSSRELFAALEQMAKLLKRASDAYASTEEAVRDSFS